MSGYVLADVEWTHEEGRLRYRELLAPALEQFDGHFVAATTDVQVKEGDWQHAGILVLIRFPTLEQALAWYRSDAYRPALQVRQASSRSRMLIFEGD